jgi:hypothetical protein
MNVKPRDFLIGCETYFLGVQQQTPETIRQVVFPLRCHSWDCPECAKEKANKYKKRMRPLFDGRKLWMYTLTYYHSRPPEEVWKDYSKAWNRFRTAAVKKMGSFSYCRVLEHHHESPYPHLHIIADKEFPATWFNREMLSAGFGYQAKCKPITTKGAVEYVTKYLTKPWTNAYCRSLRKSLRLRIVSFGGGACTSCRPGHSWKIVARGSDGNIVRNRMDIERTWTYGRGLTLTFERIVDGTSEQTFYLAPGG